LEHNRNIPESEFLLCVGRAIATFSHSAHHPQRRWLESLAEAAGQNRKRIKPDYFHLTLCVIAEPDHRDCFIAERVDLVLPEHPMSSCSFWLGRVCGDRSGAVVKAMPRQRAIQAFYRKLVLLLARRDILPLHRKSGLKPHVTLGYDACTFDPFDLPCEWIPDELLLIESEVGEGVHSVLARWPLLNPPQGILDFGDARDPLRLAA
jgi:2'-5' RNA ligase